MQGDAVARTRGSAAQVLPAMGFAALCAAFAFELWRHISTGGDFWTFWAAARAVAAGVDPYRTALLQRIAPLPPGPAPGPFLSPIFTAEWMWPFGTLPFAAARLAWLAVNAGASVLLLRLLLRASGLRPTAAVWVGGAALLMAFQPYDITLWLGQTDVLVVAALAAGWWCLSRSRPVLGGLAVALAAVDVHLLLGFGFYFVYRAVARREYRPLLGLAAGLAGLAALCLVHPADTAHWLLVTLPHAQASAIEPWDTLSVLQAASELLGRHGALAAVAPIDAGLLLLAVAAFRRPTATREQDLAVAAVLTLATATFAYNQDYLLLALAVPFLVAEWRRGAAAWWTGALTLCLAAGFGLAELTGGPVAPDHAAFIVGAPLLALAVLLGLPGVGVRPPGVGVRPPGVGVRLPGVGVRPPGVGVRPPGVGVRPPGVGVRPPGVGVRLPWVAVRLSWVGVRLPGGHRLWAGAWVALTLGGYLAFTWSHWEIGPELLMLSGVLVFLVLVGLRDGPDGAPAVPGGAPGPARPAPTAAPPARILTAEAAGPASGRGGGAFVHDLGQLP